jgi:NitT/TauT family transport system substrate-binding protein
VTIGNITWSRRGFLAGAAAIGVTGRGARPAAAKPPPETTRLRLLKETGRTWGPAVRRRGPPQGRRVHRRDLRGFPRRRGVRVPRGGEGGHQPPLRRAQHHPAGPGGSRRVPGRRARGVFRGHRHGAARRLTDLKGTIADVPDLRGAEYYFFASIAAQVAQKDITWAVNSPSESMRLLTKGKIDALLGFPPTPPELRAKKIGHVLVNSAVDRPWSQYFCCLAMSSREFLRTHRPPPSGPCAPS